MSRSLPKLPGKLGNPNLTLATDPRLAAVFAEGGIVDDFPLGADASYQEIVDHIGEMEAELDPFYQEMFGALPPVTGISRHTEVIEGVDGNEISLFIHQPAGRDGPLPGIVHTHGGGMVLCAAADIEYVRWRDELAATGLCVVGVEFRNGGGKLGNHPFPAGLNDCASGTQWTHQNRGVLGISRIVVSGESGGGNLCLATALKARQEGWIDQIDGVYSCCPYISGTYNPAPSELMSLFENEDYLLESESTQLLCKAYDPDGEQANNPLAWPYQASQDDLAGLPPHTISVNELDPLRDEGLIYARKLAAAGVSVISRTVNGTCHGGDTDCLAVIPDIYYSTIRDVHSFAASL
ncbi:MAG: alpha/beta hydrolase [Gammaproteobacteria bacterium]|jgi:acetyl esterase/lipase|nr:alpha/beta hydrolase [Gammaproteobacteria bacterium]MDP7316413.1 alpha/beta hydrolase [Pseudomonadales bacterium]|tara:strand:+ start:1399 stop:2451 length:1053 start_codon:yes stop_codon:yes gene_type:complete